MSTGEQGSVTRWIGELKAGDVAAAQPLWERYFARLVQLARAKLGLSTGALAGWFGWGVLLTSLVAAFTLAASYGVWLVATGRAALRGTSLPFGPFLLAGCLAVVLLAGVGHGSG